MLYTVCMNSGYHSYWWAVHATAPLSYSLETSCITCHYGSVWRTGNIDQRQAKCPTTGYDKWYENSRIWLADDYVQVCMSQIPIVCICNHAEIQETRAGKEVWVLTRAVDLAHYKKADVFKLRKRVRELEQQAASLEQQAKCTEGIYNMIYTCISIILHVMFIFAHLCWGRND